MTKYRIIFHEDVKGKKYFAQRKIFEIAFWRFWIDLPYISIAALGNYKEGCENPSRILKLVENYIETLAHAEKLVNLLKHKKYE